MKLFLFFACLLINFVYLISGCVEPQELINPTHFTHVPAVQNLRGGIGSTQTGKRQIALTWEFDTLNLNIRSWDVTRSVNDTSAAAYIPLEIVRKPASGFPAYIDSSGTLQGVSPDSLELYYKVIPNGLDNYIGQPSDVLFLILYRN